MTNEKLEHLVYIDELKALGMFCVITLHVNLWHIDFINATTPVVFVLLQYMLRLAAEGVPIFLLINGYLLLKKKRFDLRKHICKMMRLFLLLIVWGIILSIVLSIGNERVTYSLVVKCVLNTAVFSKNTGVLWFIQGLLAVYALFPILKYIYDNNAKLFMYLFVITALFSVGINLLDVLLQFAVIFHPSENIPLIVPFLKRVIPFDDTQILYLLHFMLGGVVASYEEVIINKRIRFIIVGVLAWLCDCMLAICQSIIRKDIFDGSYNSYGSVFILFIVVGLYALLRLHKYSGRWVNKLVCSIGKNSFGIYLTHYIFIHIINKFMNDSLYDLSSFVMRLGVVLVVIFASWLLTKILNKIPYLCYLVRI